MGYLDLNQGENQSFKGSRLTSLAIPQRVMNLVHPTGLEPVTRCLEGSCSIQLSYECINDQCCFTNFTCAVRRSLFNLVLNFVGEVGLEPTCPLGSGFTGRRANQIAQSTQNFYWFTRVPTSQWATTFALLGYLLLRSNAGPIVIQNNSYQRGTRSMLRLFFNPCMIPTFVIYRSNRIWTDDPLLPRQMLYQTELHSGEKFSENGGSRTRDSTVKE